RLETTPRARYRRVAGISQIPARTRGKVRGATIVARGFGDRPQRRAPGRGSPVDVHRVADADVLVVPGGVLGGQVDAAVADVGVALRVDRPRRGVHEHPAPGEPGGVLAVDEVALRRVQRNADGAR